MTDPYDVYNALIDLMCSRCRKDIRRECTEQDEDHRCRTKILCIKKILVPNDENYPTELPHVI